MSEQFVAYRGDPDLHDGKVLEIQRERNIARVIVQGASGKQLEIAFSGVESLTQHRAEGMVLHALAEMTANPPLRRFVFTNWDDADDAMLELTACDLDCRRL